MTVAFTEHDGRHLFKISQFLQKSYILQNTVFIENSNNWLLFEWYFLKNILFQYKKNQHCFFVTMLILQLNYVKYNSLLFLVSYITPFTNLIGFYLIPGIEIFLTAIGRESTARLQQLHNFSFHSRIKFQPSIYDWLIWCDGSFFLLRLSARHCGYIYDL